jgi:hypothetical protein
MTGMVALNYGGIMGVMRCAKDDRGGHMAEDHRWKGEI